MRKSLIIAIMALCSLTACAKKQVITLAQLPEPAKTVVSTHFASAQVSYVMLEEEFLSTEYEVKFTDGRSVEFNKDGEVTKVDCQATEVPADLVPDKVRNYVRTSFPGAFITEWKRDDRGYKAELNNGLDLEFNSNLDFLRLDD